jgi:hypothetical protein
MYPSFFKKRKRTKSFSFFYALIIFIGKRFLKNMAVIKHIQHIRSNEVTGTNPKSPASGDVHYGEIAINYHKGTETIFLRNDNDEIVKFKPSDSNTSITAITNTDSALTVSESDGEARINSALWAPSSQSGVSAIYAYTNTATGAGSFAGGSGAQATDTASFSFGVGTSATGIYSIAVGSGARATYDVACAFGAGAAALGQASHAEGSATTAGGHGSHAEGTKSKAMGTNSHAEGYSTSAAGNYTHAEGYSSSAKGAYSHAEGEFSLSSGETSHAEGDNAIAKGKASHAEGRMTQAIGAYSHAENDQTYASGTAAHSEGYATRTYSNYSHAGGYQSSATGNASFAHGSGVTTGYDCETAFGKYNVRSTGTDASAKTYFSVGIGIPSAKKNALEIRSNGDIYITTGNTASGDGTAVLLQDQFSTIWDCGDYA